MKKILVFGASNSKNSINKQLALYAASHLQNHDINAVDLNDFEMPLYGIDREKASGIPEKAQLFKTQIRKSDGIIISFAEHNGSYSTAFKNTLDWVSRIEKDVWLDKPMFLMATSPGKRGGQNVLSQATTYFPFMKGNVAARFSLPSFGQHFSAAAGITNEEMHRDFLEQLTLFRQAL